MRAAIFLPNQPFFKAGSDSRPASVSCPLVHEKLIKLAVWRRKSGGSEIRENAAWKVPKLPERVVCTERPLQIRTPELEKSREYALDCHRQRAGCLLVCFGASSQCPVDGRAQSTYERRRDDHAERLVRACDDSAYGGTKLFAALRLQLQWLLQRLQW